jgi:hypothetical protein
VRWQVQIGLYRAVQYVTPEVKLSVATIAGRPDLLQYVRRRYDNSVDANKATMQA